MALEPKDIKNIADALLQAITKNNGTFSQPKTVMSRGGDLRKRTEDGGVDIAAGFKKLDKMVEKTELSFANLIKSVKDLNPAYRLSILKNEIHDELTTSLTKGLRGTPEVIKNKILSMADNIMKAGPEAKKVIQKTIEDFSKDISKINEISNKFAEGQKLTTEELTTLKKLITLNNQGFIELSDTQVTAIKNVIYFSEALAAGKINIDKNKKKLEQHSKALDKVTDEVSEQAGIWKRSIGEISGSMGDYQRSLNDSRRSAMTKIQASAGVATVGIVNDIVSRMRTGGGQEGVGGFYGTAALQGMTPDQIREFYVRSDMDIRAEMGGTKYGENAQGLTMEDKLFDAATQLKTIGILGADATKTYGEFLKTMRTGGIAVAGRDLQTTIDNARFAAQSLGMTSDEYLEVLGQAASDVEIIGTIGLSGEKNRQTALENEVKLRISLAKAMGMEYDELQKRLRGSKYQDIQKALENKYRAAASVSALEQQAKDLGFDTSSIDFAEMSRIFQLETTGGIGAMSTDDKKAFFGKYQPLKDIITKAGKDKVMETARRTGRTDDSEMIASSIPGLIANDAIDFSSSVETSVNRLAGRMTDIPTTFDSDSERNLWLFNKMSRASPDEYFEESKSDPDSLARENEKFPASVSIFGESVVAFKDAVTGFATNPVLLGLGGMVAGIAQLITNIAIMNKLGVPGAGKVADVAGKAWGAIKGIGSGAVQIAKKVPMSRKGLMLSAAGLLGIGALGGDSATTEAPPTGVVPDIGPVEKNKPSEPVKVKVEDISPSATKPQQPPSPISPNNDSSFDSDIMDVYSANNASVGAIETPANTFGQTLGMGANIAGIGALAATTTSSGIGKIMSNAKSAITLGNAGKLFGKMIAPLSSMEGAYTGFNRSTDEYREMMGDGIIMNMLKYDKDDSNLEMLFKDTNVRTLGVLNDVFNSMALGIPEMMGLGMYGKGDVEIADLGLNDDQLKSFEGVVAEDVERINRHIIENNLAIDPETGQINEKLHKDKMIELLTKLVDGQEDVKKIEENKLRLTEEQRNIRTKVQDSIQREMTMRLAALDT